MAARSISSPSLEKTSLLSIQTGLLPVASRQKRMSKTCAKLELIKITWISRADSVATGKWTRPPR